MASIAIIPARSGSKRIPDKNIREFCGQPIIKYSIDAARESGLFDRVIVSTDSDRIGAKVAGMGATYYKRKHAEDEQPMKEAVAEVLFDSRGLYSHACVLYACAPFITAARLREGYDKLLEGGYHAVFPVWRGPDIERSLFMQDGRIRSRFPEHDQENNPGWPAAYYHCGAWFWLSVPLFLINETLVPDRSWGVVLDESECQEIDTEADWRAAEAKFVGRGVTV